MKQKIISKILISIKSKFVLIFLLLSILPLLFSFFFAVNVLIEIVQLTLSRNLSKISAAYLNDLTNNPKAKLITETLNADDELKIKLFLNMNYQVAGKIKLLFEENNLTAIAIINNTKKIKSYFHKQNQYMNEIDEKLLEQGLSGKKVSGISKINNFYYSYYISPIIDKESNHILGSILIAFNLDNDFLENILVDKNSFLCLYDFNKKSIIASTKKTPEIKFNEEISDYTNENTIVSNFFVNYNLQKNDGLLIITGIDRSESKYVIWLTIRRFIVIGFVLILGSIMLGVFTANKIIAPVRALTDTIKDSIKKNELEPVKLNYSGKDEVYELAVLFNEMVVKLNEAQENLIRTNKLASIGQLSAGISHEINNPLVTILGYTQLILEKIDKEKEPKLFKYLKIIEDDTKRCKNTISNLLNFARPAENIVEPVNINSVIANTVSLFEMECKKNNISLTFTDTASNPVIYANTDQIKQVFVNLMFNAIYSLK
ncbi:hypothetical protein KA977_11230, partial [Candidatus Dependentiae bacterium]|nr:hypothetical protein [Candidatus Dependentiae bacterium]